MPKVCRVMLPEGGRPLVGDRKFMLGVRIGKPPHGDLELTGRGTVMLGMGGMSVGRHWKEMPYFLIPPRLRHLVSPPKKQRAAGGNDEVRCWRMGEGEFMGGRVNDSLVLRLDTAKHGLIEPTSEIAIDDFQAALADTRDAWQIDEEL